MFSDLSWKISLWNFPKSESCHNQCCRSFENGTILLGSCPSNSQVHPLAISLATSTWYGIRTLPGEWHKCNHSNTPCNCQSAPVGTDGECKISNSTGCFGFQHWSWAVIIALCTLTNACQASSISSQSEEGLGSPLSSWKGGNKVSVVSFREVLSQLIAPSSFCKSFKVFKLSFLITTFWGWIKRPSITYPKYWETFFVPFPGQCTNPRHPDSL
jgi:hypothetical protein